MASTRTRVLGTTRIEEAIAEGGMAEVYRGHQPSLGRLVAVKVMLPKIGRDRDMAQRFRREARTLAALQHENIVAVHDLVEKNRQIFMVLEYVDGLDVADLLRDAKTLPLDVALIIANGVARALEHAHFRRIIHRDVKPPNVMVSRRGEVKLADFGIAKELVDADLTHTGFVIGTPSYVPPEVLKGERADHRGDIYAAGVLLYECLTGQKPFRGKTPPELARAIVTGQREKLRALAPDCPRPVEKIVDTCLELDPRKRYQRAADLRQEVEAQLQKLVNGNPAARLVGFMFSRGLADAEDLGTLDIGELVSADPTLQSSLAKIKAAQRSVESSIEIDVAAETQWELTRRRSKRWPIAVLVALVLLLGAGVTYAVAPAGTFPLVDRIAHELRALGR